MSERMRDISQPCLLHLLVRYGWQSTLCSLPLKHYHDHPNRSDRTADRTRAPAPRPPLRRGEPRLRRSSERGSLLQDLD